MVRDTLFFLKSKSFKFLSPSIYISEFANIAKPWSYYGCPVQC